MPHGRTATATSKGLTRTCKGPRVSRRCNGQPTRQEGSRSRTRVSRRCNGQPPRQSPQHQKRPARVSQPHTRSEVSRRPARPQERPRQARVHNAPDDRNTRSDNANDSMRRTTARGSPVRPNGPGRTTARGDRAVGLSIRVTVHVSALRTEGASRPTISRVIEPDPRLHL